MQRRSLTVAVACVVTVGMAGCAAPREAANAQGTPDARAEFVDREGRRIGEAILREGDNGVLVRLRLEGAPAGTRAIHVHGRGACTPDFAAAGDHWNPRARAHGFLNPQGAHLGDLPNLSIPADGRLEAEFFLHDARLSGAEDALLDGDGSAFILHAGADDHRTDPSGDAGDRIACAVITGS